jgi:hypothetical protein
VIIVEELTNYRRKLYYCMAVASEVKKCKYYAPITTECSLCKYRERIDTEGTYGCDYEETIA